VLNIIGSAEIEIIACTFPLVLSRFMARTSRGDQCSQPYHVDLHVHNPHGVEAEKLFPVFLLGAWKTHSEWKAHLLNYTRYSGL
jgi:hypothetical protein